MEIKILRPVSLDIEGKQKVYSPSDKTISISDDLAKEKNYVERYKKYPKHIQIIKLPSVDKEVVPEVKAKPKSKKVAKTKE